MRCRSGLLRLQADLRQVPDRAFDGLRCPITGRAGVLDPERPDRRAAQANQVSPAPERSTDVGHEHAYVRAAGTRDPNVDVS